MLYQILDPTGLDVSSVYSEYIHEPLHLSSNAAPPAYSFCDLCESSGTISLKEGSNHDMAFIVISDPTLGPCSSSVLSREGGSPRKNIYLEGSVIHFKNVNKIDAGKYTISSFNSAGQGQGSFSLKIKCKLEACGVTRVQSFLLLFLHSLS